MDEITIRTLLEDNFELDHTQDDLIQFILAEESIYNILKVDKLISEIIEHKNNKRKIYVFDEWDTIFIEIKEQIEWKRWDALNDKILIFMFNNKIENINISHVSPDVVLPNIDQKW